MKITSTQSAAARSPRRSPSERPGAGPASISTPDKVESRLGTLIFKDGVPDNATAQKLFDELDYVHAVEAFINGFAAVNQLALRKGFIAAGINDNDVYRDFGADGCQVPLPDG